MSVLSVLVDYVVVKRKQVDFALNFIESRLKRPKGFSYSIDELHYLFNLRLETQRLSGSKIKYNEDTYSFEDFCSFVKARRTKLDTFVWSKKKDSLLGTDTGGNIAEKLNINRPAIQKRGSDLGITPYRFTFKGVGQYAI